MKSLAWAIGWVAGWWFNRGTDLKWYFIGAYRAGKKDYWKSIGGEE